VAAIKGRRFLTPPTNEEKASLQGKTFVPSAAPEASSKRSSKIKKGNLDPDPLAGIEALTVCSHEWMQRAPEARLEQATPQGPPTRKEVSQMRTKIITACMAIAAFAAFVIAPVASASPTIFEGATALAVGASVKGTNTGDTLFTGSGGITVRCSHAELKGTITQNGGEPEQIKGKVPKTSGATEHTDALFTGTGTSGDCTSPLGAVKPTVTSDLCFETLKGTDNITITGCAVKAVTFSLIVTGATTCKYTTATVVGEDVVGTFSTTGDATVNVQEKEAKLAEPNIFCPSTGKLDMDFDLTTTDGTTLTIS
jgi:hypothetical protein